MIAAYSIEGNYLGTFDSFGDAKRAQQSSLPEELRFAYAGIGVDGQPLFHEESLTPELCEKYKLQ